MPEGDSVYRLARRLDAALAGAMLTGCDIRVPEYATVDLTGERIDEVVSRGKHILIRVGDHTVHSHLKMEGMWQLYRPGERWKRPAFQARIVLTTTGWQAVGFELGMLGVLPRDREVAVVGHLGPDLLGPDWDAGEATRRLAAHPSESISVALLDQRNLAGLGNEYVAELCFLRGMLPTRLVRDADLLKTVALAHRLIVANKDRAVRTTTGDLRPGSTSWVYRRENQPCRRCGARIRRGQLGSGEGEAANLTPEMGLPETVTPGTDTPGTGTSGMRIGDRQIRAIYVCPFCQS
ncbi:DNA-formamidopyrimidine glycosylase family protein [Rathayibacter soli]|uniref:DNA-formamidopyrimidine glycosylase family protein n=1 Tax=Rathayibacter soli TaxID=3144168 RepID=UPI0027E4A101|nr:DNA-formamidopyrimidine glycosylase family protein [Glaciibacter superstes]